MEGFFARRTTTHGETLCREEESEADRDFVSRYVAMEVFPIWREEESETRGRPETAREETDRPLPSRPGFGKNVKFPPSFAKMQNHWIPQFELFGKLVKCKPQLQNHWRCS